MKFFIKKLVSKLLVYIVDNYYDGWDEVCHMKCDKE